MSEHIRPSKRVYFTLQWSRIKLVRPLSTVDNTRDYARVSHSTRQWSNYNLKQSIAHVMYTNLRLISLFSLTSKSTSRSRILLLLDTRSSLTCVQLRQSRLRQAVTRSRYSSAVRPSYDVIFYYATHHQYSSLTVNPLSMWLLGMVCDLYPSEEEYRCIEQLEPQMFFHNH